MSLYFQVILVHVIRDLRVESYFQDLCVFHYYVVQYGIWTFMDQHVHKVWPFMFKKLCQVNEESVIAAFKY